MWYDADIDAVMARTAKRPIPQGRVAPNDALAFGVAMAGGSVITLGLLVSWTASALLAFTIFFYVVIYTMWLKRRTAQNIVIGGAAGALPPVVAWAAVTGGIDIAPLVLFLIIFLWTPPHFWALALYRTGDYARAGVPMLPVVAGAGATRLQILIYTLVLAPAGVAPYLLHFAGPVYGAVSTLAGAAFIGLAVRLYRAGDGPQADAHAKRLFAFSVLYLFGLFATLLIEAGLRWPEM
jgi:protoheme IX farnesyltransferase